MAGIDELIERLLYDAALSGSRGLGADEFEAAVRKFYDEQLDASTHRERPVGSDLLFADTPSSSTFTVDDSLFTSAYQWLCKHPDIEVRAVDAPGGDQSGLSSQNSALQTELTGKRIFASDDRTWHAITGHGVDPRRVPLLEFDLLSVIAIHGPAGILQPLLIKLTGQDKRSVPKRTDALTVKGYITKDTVIGCGQRTSSLKLKRYATADAPRPAESGDTESDTSQRKKPLVYYDYWFDETIKLMQSNNNILTMPDLREKLGIQPNSFEVKLLVRCVRRLAQSGCVRQLTARVTGEDGNPLIIPGTDKERMAKAVELLRQPTEFDRLRWKSRGAGVQNTSREMHSEGAVEKDDAAVSGDEGELIEVDEEQHDLDLMTERIPPQWTPDLLTTNLFHNIVDASGRAGLNSVRLSSRLSGPLWRRPLDEISNRLTDIWEYSQPLHLKHLGIVRDTSVYGKLVIFRYRTLPNFEKAVEAGEVVREAVENPKAQKGKEKKGRTAQELDQWGFPKIPLKELARRDGRATLLQGWEIFQIASDITHRTNVKPNDPNAGIKETAADSTPTGRAERRTHMKRKRRNSAENVSYVNGARHYKAPNRTTRPRTYSNGADGEELAAPPISRTSIRGNRGKRKRRESADDSSELGFDKTFHRRGELKIVPTIKKRKIPPEEYEDFDRFAQVTAERQVMVEFKANPQRADRQKGEIPFQGRLRPKDLPQDRVAQVKTQILARDSPGVYINPPGARNIKLERLISRGRPRKALIAVFKSKKLETLVWFQHEAGRRLAPQATRLRTAAVGIVARTPSNAEESDARDEVSASKRFSTRGDVDSPFRPTHTPTSSGASQQEAESSPTGQQNVQWLSNPNLAATGVPIREFPTLPALSFHQRQNVYDAQNDAQNSAQLSVESASTNRHAKPTALPQKFFSHSSGTPTIEQFLPTLPLSIENETPVSHRPIPGTINTLSGTLEMPLLPQTSAATELRLLKTKKGRKSTQQKARLAELLKIVETEEVIRKQNSMSRKSSLVQDSPHGKVPAVKPLTPTPEKEIDGHKRSLLVKLPGSCQAPHKAASNDISGNENSQYISDRAPANDPPGIGSHSSGTNKNALYTDQETIFRSDLHTSAVFENPTLSEITGHSDIAGSNGRPRRVSSVPIANASDMQVPDAADSTDKLQDVVPLEQSLPETAPLESPGIPQPQEEEQTRNWVKSAYVDRHPKENFYHRGKGWWARGLPPLGSCSKVGVRGPDAKVWKASQGVKTSDVQSVNMSDSQSRTIRKPLPPLHRTMSHLRPDDQRAQSNMTLQVKLSLPGYRLAQFTSADVDTSMDLAETGDQSTKEWPGISSLNQPFESFYSAEACTTQLQDTAQQILPAATSNEWPRKSLAPLMAIIRPYRDYSGETIDRRLSSDALDIPSAFVPQTDTDGTIASSEVEPNISRISEPAQLKSGDGHPIGDIAEPQSVESNPDFFNVLPSTPVPLADTTRRTPKRVGTARGGGTIAAQRQKIILDAVRSCNGVFPGGHEAWYVSCTAWKRLHGQVPDRHTIDHVIKNLVENRKLKKLTFQFRSKRGLVVRRFMLVEPGTEPYSPLAKDMQKKIIEAYPEVYLPPEADIDEEMRRKADNAHGRAGSSLLETTANNYAPAGQRNWFSHDPSATVQAGSNTFPRLESKSTAATEHQIMDWVDDGNLPSQSPRRNSVYVITKSGKKRYQLAQLSRPRRPLTSLLGRLGKHNRRNRDFEAEMTLDDESRHRRHAACLYMHPTQSFYATTGTYATAGLLTATNIRESRTFRNRSVAPDGFGVEFTDPDQLRAILQNAESLDGAQAQTANQKVSQFFREIDQVRLWEERNPDIIAVGGDNFINHTLNQKHIYATPTRNIYLSTVPELASAVPNLALLGPPSASIIPIPAGKLRGKYKSRAKQVAVDGGLRDSDSEFVPGTAKIHPATRETFGRDRKASAAFRDADRLVKAYALVNAICGGINQDRLNWTLIAHALSFRYDAEFLRRRWAPLRGLRKSEAERLRDAIREPFLAAYEKDELPRVDFSNLANTDWPGLFEWAEQVCSPKASAGIEVSDLLESREAFEESFIVKDRVPIFERPKDDFFTATTDLNRRNVAVRYSHVVTLPGQTKPSEEIEEDKALIKSWIRAVSVTKQWNYNVAAATKKLKTFFNDNQLQQACTEMVESHLFSLERKGRLLPGRNYQIHGDVLAQFRRWPAKPEEHQYLRLVAQAYLHINQHFKAHEQLVLIPAASDPEYLVLNNMLAQGLLRTSVELPERNDEQGAPFPKLSAWSYGPIGYEMKKVDVGNLKFPITFTKTVSYAAHHGLKHHVPPPLEPPLTAGEPSQRIPFWIDIHGNFVHDIWDMVVRSILHLIVFRPGSTAVVIQKAHSDKFWAWEIEMVFKWMEEVGIATRCGAGTERNGMWKGGWKAGAWWYCAFVPEVATWQAPNGIDFGVTAGG